jgi:AcrR family transcriptional regulator
MSFYRNFASKDDLVVAYLLGERQKFWQRWELAFTGYSGNPSAQVEALFDALAANACQDCWLRNEQRRSRNHRGGPSGVANH